MFYKLKGSFLNISHLFCLFLFHCILFKCLPISFSYLLLLQHGEISPQGSIQLILSTKMLIILEVNTPKLEFWFELRHASPSILSLIPNQKVSVSVWLDIFLSAFRLTDDQHVGAHLTVNVIHELSKSSPNTHICAC